MFLTLLSAALAATFFYYGFVAPGRHARGQLKAGFVIMIAMTMFAGYFAWREFRSVGELAELIEPVPEITDVMYVPTPGEIQGLSSALSAAPALSRRSRPEDIDRLAAEAKAMTTRHWSLETRLSVAEVVAFYRDARNRRDWILTRQEPPALILKRNSESMFIWVLAADEGSSVYYSHDSNSEGSRH
jgi:hypothetical protein